MAVYVLDERQTADLLALRVMQDWWHVRNLVVRSERAKRRG